MPGAKQRFLLGYPTTRSQHGWCDSFLGSSLERGLVEKGQSDRLYSTCNILGTWALILRTFRPQSDKRERFGHLTTSWLVPQRKVQPPLSRPHSAHCIPLPVFTALGALGPCASFCISGSFTGSFTVDSARLLHTPRNVKEVLKATLFGISYHIWHHTNGFMTEFSVCCDLKDHLSQRWE